MICRVAESNTPFYQPFDYLIPENLNVTKPQIGCRVVVPFGKTEKIGFIVELCPTSEIEHEKLKSISELLDETPLLSQIDLDLLRWTSRYYHHPLGEVISAAFPVTLRQKGKKLSPTKKLKKSDSFVASHAPLHLNSHQQNAFDSVLQTLNSFTVFLLEGVTGSGKTEIYMQLIQKVLQSGQQILVLVPEITLTPQLETRFKQRFTVNIAVSHSRLSNEKRKIAWLEMQSGESSILLGTRSALFTPLKNAGLIILDEEHDASFKQQEGFRFSARDVAVMRGKFLNIPVILGSATPSFESLHNVNLGRYQHLRLPERAGDAQSPDFYLLDIRQQKLRDGLSNALITEITRTVEKKEQVLLFLNRRGFAPTLICHDCGWMARCLYCDANLVLHQTQKILRCHHCNTEHRLIFHCLACKKGKLTPLGLGTQRIEQTLHELFPLQTIIRLDRDSISRKGELENYLTQINNGDADIILGTQLLAKGHHFANVTLVALLDCDSSLFSADFHAAEKLAQLIVQVAGRAGREQKRGKVILQTHQPNHPLLAELVVKGYHAFAQTALLERQIAQLPPFSHQALLRASAQFEKEAIDFLEHIAQWAHIEKTAQLQILGSVPAPMTWRGGRYHYQLLFQSENRADLQTLLAKLVFFISECKVTRKVRWSLDVDPIDLY